MNRPTRHIAWLWLARAVNRAPGALAAIPITSKRLMSRSAGSPPLSTICGSQRKSWAVLASAKVSVSASSATSAAGQQPFPHQRQAIVAEIHVAPIDEDRRGTEPAAPDQLLGV